MQYNQTTMVCPSCGLSTLNLFEYSSLMALRQDLGLFTVECPNCQSKISSIQPIPLQLQKEVVRVANEVNAGMGVDRGGLGDSQDDGSLSDDRSDR
ncbi:MAG: UDP-N-acetylmuramoylalanyl-D-glutamate--2,6-diaminopimelate ligase [Eggerthellaceae bacterium]|nr:UDP-N-acetylmuramoylalanyl-D-glutamate--2,6-diaminopimelate ligase [Eggerthellaceae bacterium]